MTTDAIAIYHQPANFPQSIIPCDHAAITNGHDATFDPPIAGVYVGSAGTLTLTMNGNAAQYTVVDGSYIWGKFTAYTHGSASNVVALQA